MIEIVQKVYDFLAHFCMAVRDDFVDDFWMTLKCSFFPFPKNTQKWGPSVFITKVDFFFQKIV